MTWCVGVDGVNPSLNRCKSRCTMCKLCHSVGDHTSRNHQRFMDSIQLFLVQSAGVTYIFWGLDYVFLLHSFIPGGGSVLGEERYRSS